MFIARILPNAASCVFLLLAACDGHVEVTNTTGMPCNDLHFTTNGYTIVSASTLPPDVIFPTVTINNLTSSIDCSGATVAPGQKVKLKYDGGVSGRVTGYFWTNNGTQVGAATTLAYDLSYTQLGGGAVSVKFVNPGGPLLYANLSIVTGADAVYLATDFEAGMSTGTPVSLLVPSSGTFPTGTTVLAQFSPSTAPNTYTAGSATIDGVSRAIAINPTLVPTMIPVCIPGQGGVISCPCSNPPVPPGLGCNNFAGGGTGGAILSGVGVASVSADTLGFNFSAGVGSSVTVLFQGTTNTVNTRSGAGIRCVGGTLKRLYKGNESAGAISFPTNAVAVHLQSAAKGFPITPPITLYYYASYRNSAANGQPGCPGLSFGFNTSNAGAVNWIP